MEALIDVVGDADAMRRMQETIASKAASRASSNRDRQMINIDTIRKQDNIYELKAVIEEFEKRQENSGLRDFLAEVTLKSDQDSISEEEGVLLMTLHASKGPRVSIGV